MLGGGSGEMSNKQWATSYACKGTPYPPYDNLTSATIQNYDPAVCVVQLLNLLAPQSLISFRARGRKQPG